MKRLIARVLVAGTLSTGLLLAASAPAQAMSINCKRTGADIGECNVKHDDGSVEVFTYPLPEI